MSLLFMLMLEYDQQPTWFDTLHSYGYCIPAQVVVDCIQTFILVTRQGC